MKYRKKPVVIEAFQYDGDLMNSNGEYYVPEWAIEAHEEKMLFYSSKDSNSPPCELYVHTLEGVARVDIGNYIIQGVKGEIYSCRPDIFELTYERDIDEPTVQVNTEGE